MVSGVRLLAAWVLVAGFGLNKVEGNLFAHQKDKNQKDRKKNPPQLVLTSLCEEAENQFRWLIENPSDKSVEFTLKSDDKAGVSFDGEVGPQSSLFVITYRRLKFNKGADSWTLRSRDQSISLERSTDICRQWEEPPPPIECPPIPDPVICPPTPDPVICPEPVVCDEPIICAPPAEPIVCDEPIVCPEPPPTVPGEEAGLPHPCLAATDPMQWVAPFEANVKIRTDLTDITRSFSYYEDIRFSLKSCDSLSISGRFTQSSTRNTFTLESKIYLETDLQLGATKIALLASDGSLISESACDLVTCELSPFLVRDLQGNFGLASQSRYFIVIDYDLGGEYSQKALVMNTD